MTDAELAALLKDRLKLSVSTERKTEFGPVEQVRIKVTLAVGETLVAEGEDWFDLPAPARDEY